MKMHLLIFLALAACSKAKVGISTQNATSVVPTTTFLTSKCSTEYFNTAPNDFRSLFPEINMTNVTELKAVSTDNVYANSHGIFANSFAAILNNGTVVSWGSTLTGGDNSSIPVGISSANPVEKIYSTMLSHLAVLKDGTLKGWGNAASKATQTEIDLLGITSANPIVSISKTPFGFGFILQDGTLATIGVTDITGATTMNANFTQVAGGKKAISLMNNGSAFAAILDDGTVKVWGHAAYGGTQAQVDALNITTAVKIYGNQYSMAALLQDGTVKVWGDVNAGGDQSQVDALSFSSANPVKEIFTTRYQAYAALLQDGTVKAWGNSLRGGDQTAVNSLNFTSGNPVKKIYSTYNAFIALLQNGTVKVWGDVSSGGDQTEVDALNITPANPVKAIFPLNYELGMNQAAVAAILQDGTVKVWGSDGMGGDQTVVDALGFSSANPVTTIFPNDYSAGTGFGGSFTALLKDGTIKVWGDVTRAGDQTEVAALGITSANPVINIYTSAAANVALLKDGTVKAWGNTTTFSPANQSALFTNLSSNPVVEMYASLGGFVGVRKNGSVSVWGADSNPSYNFGAIQTEVDALNFGTSNHLRANAKICTVTKCSAGSVAPNSKYCL